MSTQGDSDPREQDDSTSPDGDDFWAAGIEPGDTVDSFIRRFAQEMATGEGLEGAVRDAFIERTISLGIRSWESPAKGWTIVEYDEEALATFKDKYLAGGANWGTVEKFDVSEARELARQAREDPDFVKETSAYVRQAQAAALMRPGVTAAESEIHAFGETLRQAGFHEIAIDNATEMFQAYNNMYANMGRNAEFHKYAEILGKKVTLAAQQGVISDQVRDDVLKDIGTRRETYRLWTPEETQAWNDRRAEGMKPYQDLLTEMEYLRDSFAKRGNTSLGAGALPFLMALETIRDIDAFQKIVREGTVKDAQEFVRNNELQRWKDNPGGLTRYTDQLTESDAWHFGFFKRAHAVMEATGWPPAVGAAKIMDNVIEGNRKGLSDKDITYNIAVDLVSEFALKKFTGGAPGKLGREAMAEFVRVSATEFVKEPTRDGLGKALSTGFYEAVTTVVTKDAVKQLTPKQGEALKEFFIEVASKLGALEAVKPYIERVFAPPTKEQASVAVPGASPVAGVMDTANYKAMLASAKTLTLPPDVSPDRLALKGSEVARRENVDASVVVQGTRNPEAFTALDPALNLRTSTFTVAEVRQMDVDKTIQALEQRDDMQQAQVQQAAMRQG